MRGKEDWVGKSLSRKELGEKEGWRPYRTVSLDLTRVRL